MVGRDGVRILLVSKSPEAAAKAQNALADQLEKMGLHPAIYRAVRGQPEEREAVVAYRRFGHVVERKAHENTVSVPGALNAFVCHFRETVKKW